MLTEQVDINNLSTRADLLYQTIAPLDLHKVPIYIAPQFRLSTNLRGGTIIDGFYLQACTCIKKRERPGLARTWCMHCH